MPAWKGLETTRSALFLDYGQIDRMVQALLPAAADWQADAVVGIARGGIVPATIAAASLCLPLAFLSFDRASQAIQWMSAPPATPRVLLVDDCASTGATLASVRASLLAEQRQVLTLAVVHDPEVSAYSPDLSHPLTQLWRFPWERGEATPRARQQRQAGAPRQLDDEQSYFGIDLDGIFLADMPSADYAADLQATLAARDQLQRFAVLPKFALDRASIITGRPESDRLRTQAWLNRHGFGHIPLEMRPADCPAHLAAVIRYKAGVATRLGCTHYIESEAEQAIGIAAQAAQLTVSWWNCQTGICFVVAATAQAVSAPTPAPGGPPPRPPKLP